MVFFALTAKGELGRSDYAGLLGGKILKRFKVILDYTHEWMVLEPTQQLPEPFESDMSGMVLEVKGRDFSTYRVARILDGSPASEAGLVKGDLLISVDGKPPAAVGLLEIYRQFEQEGREHSLEIMRKGQLLKISLRTRRLI